MIINYTGTAAKLRRQASILNLLVNNNTTDFFNPFEKQAWTDQGQFSEMCGWLLGANSLRCLIVLNGHGHCRTTAVGINNVKLIVQTDVFFPFLQ